MSTLNSYLPALVSILQRAVGIFLVYLSSRFLGDTDYADFAIAKATINNFIIASNAGAVILSTKLYSNAKLRNAAEMTIEGVYTSLAVYVVIFLLFFNIFMILSVEDIRVSLSISLMSLVFVFTAYNSFLYGKNIAEDKLLGYTKISLFSVIFCLPIVFLSIKIFGYIGAVISYILFPFVMSLILGYSTDRIVFRVPQKAHLKIFWSSGMKNQLSGLINVLGILFMYYFLRHVVEDVKGVRYLDILILFQGLVLLLTGSFSTVLLPKLITGNARLTNVMVKSSLSILLALTVLWIFQDEITRAFNIADIPNYAYLVFLATSIVIGVKKNLAQVFLSHNMEGKILMADFFWLAILLLTFNTNMVLDISGVAKCYLYSHISHLILYLIYLFKKFEGINNYA